MEPEWEARFEPKSYGFRPGRGCHDAIEAIYQTAKGKSPKRRWVLDADLAAAFDRIAHDHILRQLGTFPARGMVEQWLKAGVVENGRLPRTEEGTPQGGVVSPVLLNVALHGMEKAAGVRYRTTGSDAGWTVAGSPVLIRYADDLVALCHTRHEALEVKARLAAWLAPRGLAFNEDKTRVVTLDEGFDFLGFNVRRYHGKLLIKPSKAAVRRIRERLRTEMRSLRGANAQAVIKRLNPIIRGWAAYYRTVVSSEIFAALDNYLWKLTYKWADLQPPEQADALGRRPVLRQVQQVQARPVGVRRPRQAAPTCSSSPGPRSSDTRWSRARRPRTTPPWPSTGPATTQSTAPADRHDQPAALEAQDGRCPICGDLLLPADDQPQTPHEWEHWLATTRKTIIKIVDAGGRHVGRRQTPSHTRPLPPPANAATTGPALLPAHEPSGLA